MKRKFNEDYYDVSVQEWENTRIPQSVLNSRLAWIPAAALVGWFAVGQFVSDHNWQFWLGYAASVFLVSSLFALIEEVNENVRYVRRQLHNFRHAVGQTSAEIGQYNRPQNATVQDVLQAIDRNWVP